MTTQELGEMINLRAMICSKEEQVQALTQENERLKKPCNPDKCVFYADHNTLKEKVRQAIPYLEQVLRHRETENMISPDFDYDQCHTALCILQEAIGGSDGA